MNEVWWLAGCICTYSCSSRCYFYGRYNTWFKQKVKREKKKKKQKTHTHRKQGPTKEKLIAKRLSHFRNVKKKNCSLLLLLEQSILMSIQEYDIRNFPKWQKAIFSLNQHIKVFQESTLTHVGTGKSISLNNAFIIHISWTWLKGPRKWNSVSGIFCTVMLSNWGLEEWVNKRTGDIWVTDKFQGPWPSSDFDRLSRPLCPGLWVRL